MCWHEGVPVLQSIYHPTVWPADSPLHATCEKAWSPFSFLRQIFTHSPGEKPHTPPALDCRCGIYAMSRVELDAQRELALGFGIPICGVVQLWGRVVQHEHGFRAEYARPLQLVEAPSLWRGREEKRLLDAVVRRYQLAIVSRAA